MATAKCFKCGGSAISDTFQQAEKLINHAVGLTRGIKCGASYNMVREIKPATNNIPTPEKPVVTNIVTNTVTSKPEKTKSTSEKSKTKKSSNQ